MAAAGGSARLPFGRAPYTAGVWMHRERGVVPDAGTPADVVMAEKLREDDLRAEGLTVVRWISRDIDRFDRVAARLRRGFTMP